MQAFPLARIITMVLDAYKNVATSYHYANHESEVVRQTERTLIAQRFVRNTPRQLICEFCDSDARRDSNWFLCFISPWGVILIEHSRSRTSFRSWPLSAPLSSATVTPESVVSRSIFVGARGLVPGELCSLNIKFRPLVHFVYLAAAINVDRRSGKYLLKKCQKT